MQVAITGANGFLGRELSRQLLESGFDVSAYSRHAGPA
jgi:uncharacterized protein YbjT (DUF2867 family)